MHYRIFLYSEYPEVNVEAWFLSTYPVLYKHHVFLILPIVVTRHACNYDEVLVMMDLVNTLDPVTLALLP